MKGMEEMVGLVKEVGIELEGLGGERLMVGEVGRWLG